MGRIMFPDYRDLEAAKEFEESDDFQPGSFGFHELVDRLLLVFELFDREIAQHPAADYFSADIDEIGDKLYSLYNKAATT
jgi:hypothetical protein